MRQHIELVPTSTNWVHRMKAHIALILLPPSTDDELIQYALWARSYILTCMHLVSHNG